MDQSQKRRQPRLNHDETAGWTQQTANFTERPFQVPRQISQMVKAALNDHDIHGSIGQPDIAAIADEQLRITVVELQQVRGEIDAAEIREPK